MNGLQQYIQKHWLWIIVNIGSLVPLAWLILTFNQSINPIDDITDVTGKSALILLILSLACTPLSAIFGFKKAVTVRKSLGLYAFLYVSLHLLTFAGLDYGLNWGQIFVDAVLEKRYVLVGFVAFLIMVPLAITSTKGWMKRLGRNWKRLHKWVYLAAGLAVLHYLWVVKIDIREPLLYGGLLALLLLMRVPQVRKYLSAQRRNLFGKKQATKAVSRTSPTKA